MSVQVSIESEATSSLCLRIKNHVFKMKGIVFTEFLEMVEDKFGYETVDALLTENELPSGGVYTAVGTYEHAEMVTLVSHLHRRTEVPLPILLNTFGKHLFGIFVKAYGHFFEGVKDAFSFLESIENYIHVEVRKLYPDAELPTFDTKRVGDDALEMIYRSDRRMADLAEGLIESALEHFDDKADIEREMLDDSGAAVKFTIKKHS